MKHQSSEQNSHHHTLLKFILLALVIVGYFAYLSIQYDFSTGFMITAITWSFFVLCTPVADAGFLLDFPIRLLFGVRMLFTEILVWALAILINGFALAFSVESYEHNVLTQVFKQILLTPIPYWSIILLCGLGTFLSIHFGDELMDATHNKHHTHEQKHKTLYKLLIMVGLLLVILWFYGNLMDQMGLGFLSD